MNWRETYNAYMQSFKWKGKRMRLIAERGKCERCGRRGKLELHHKTYERLGEELDSDLEVLCPGCHRKADREREEESASRAADALYDARLDGWASKRYGEDWEWRLDAGAVAEEFDYWLEGREE